MHWRTSYGNYNLIDPDEKFLALTIFTPKRFKFVISSFGRDLEHYEQWFDGCETTEELVGALKDCYSGYIHHSDQERLNEFYALAESRGIMWDYQRTRKRMIDAQRVVQQAKHEVDELLELLPVWECLQTDIVDSIHGGYASNHPHRVWKLQPLEGPRRVDNSL